ncbi:MAG: molybdopterin-guanine dinucleotide biosynthesis protein B [Dehalococcoidales bacterium]|nr:molybdopterin-guanine dinucleotide biosynthesis protein B [Dehalococcoidales bacterium]
MIPVISVVGRSNVGKTTFLEKVVKELKSRGYRMAVVKHDSHSFDIDHPGKDSWRLTQAGADVVAISSADKMAMVKRPARELTLDQLTGIVMNGVDIIITEGYKGADKPKIEVFRSDISDRILSQEQDLLALVTDKHFDLDVPQFTADDANGIVDLIIERFLNQTAEEDITLYVNGNYIKLKSFIKDAFINTISGMVSTLHGAENTREIKLTIHLP